LNDPASAAPHRSGFVALAGRPNVGKSTIVNAILGAKVAITAAAPQTTRAVLRAIVTTPGAQLVLLDTPGIHEPRHRLGEFMVEGARRALREVDLILWVVDGAAGLVPEDRTVAAALQTAPRPTILAVNKVDQAEAARVENVVRAAQSTLPLAAIHRIAARTGLGIEALHTDLINRLPAGPPYYPEDMLADQPEQFLIREFIREQVIRRTRQEVPHAVAVEIDAFTERPDGAVSVRATVHVEKPSQKKILIGRDGRMLKTIGIAARVEAERLLGRTVHLHLWVAVTPDWRQKPALIRGFYPE
jgi:GTP-binding protein Era